MDQVILEFIHTLRRAGLPVSSSEALDGLVATDLTGIRDRERVRVALRAALVKRERDIPLFNAIFDRFFGLQGDAEALGAAAFRPGQAGELRPGEMDDLEQAIRTAQEALDRLGQQIRELTEALLRGDMATVQAMLAAELDRARPSEMENPLQQGRLTREILQRLDWSQVLQEMQALIAALAQMGEHRLAHLLQQRVRDVRELFPRWVADEVASGYRRTNPEWRPPLGPALMQKDFASFTDSEVQAMRRLVDDLARRLREDISRRRQRGGRKRLDVSRTLRLSLATAGVPMELAFKQPRRNRLRLALLCDVSSSVRNAARFMLQLVYSLQQQRGQVRSFVFISDLAEVTDFFERNPLEAAVQMALSEAEIRYWAHSDFGRAFRIFLDEYPDAVNSRTTVIVLGDGRSNFHDPQLDALAAIRERARRLIWLNPEPRWGWGHGDSIIDLYAQECDLLAECRNLEQLKWVMEMLSREAV